MDSVIEARGGGGNLPLDHYREVAQESDPPKYLHTHKVTTHTSTKSHDVNVSYVVCAHI